MQSKVKFFGYDKALEELTSDFHKARRKLLGEPENDVKLGRQPMLSLSTMRVFKSDVTVWIRYPTLSKIGYWGTDFTPVAQFYLENISIKTELTYKNLVVRRFVLETTLIDFFGIFEDNECIFLCRSNLDFEFKISGDFVELIVDYNKEKNIIFYVGLNTLSILDSKFKHIVYGGDILEF